MQNSNTEVTVASPFAGQSLVSIAKQHNMNIKVSSANSEESPEFSTLQCLVIDNTEIALSAKLQGITERQFKELSGLTGSRICRLLINNEGKLDIIG